MSRQLLSSSAVSNMVPHFLPGTPVRDRSTRLPWPPITSPRARNACPRKSFGLEMLVLESTLYLKRVEAVWGGAGGRQSGKAFGFRVLVKIVGWQKGVAWARIQPGSPVGQESGSERVREGEAKSRAFWGAEKYGGRDLDGGGAKKGSRVVGRTRQGQAGLGGGAKTRVKLFRVGPNWAWGRSQPRRPGGGGGGASQNF